MTTDETDHLTVAAEDPLPTELVPPIADSTPSPLAYSAEPPPDPPAVEPPGQPRWRVTAIAAAILLAAGLLATAIYVTGRPAQDRHAAEVAPPPSRTEPTPAAPTPATPPTVTVTAEAPPPPSPAPIPEPLPPDALFTQMLARDGVGNSHPSGAIATAKNICQTMARGWTANDVVLDMNRAGMPYREAVAFVHDARAVYCPGLGG